MKIQDIVDYVQHTPSNTNAAILSGLIKEWGELQNYVERIGIEKVTDYLYEATFTDWNYSLGREHWAKLYPKMGACSSIRAGNYYGRNYDWYYNNQLECIVHCNGGTKRHSSIGVATIPSAINDDAIADGTYNELFEVIPFCTLDGLNDAGVVCNINVVPPGDKGYTSGTNPGKIRMCATMIPRYVLDYADSARDAVERLMNDVDIYGMYGDIEEEIHVMIGDNISTYIVEFIENGISVLSDQDDEFDELPNDVPIMTNFHLTDFNGELVTGFEVEGGITEEDTTLEPHAAGVERYQILLDGAEDVESLDDMIDLMESIKYTLAYDEDIDPYWYSELVGYTNTFGDLTIYQNKEDYAGIKEIFEDLYVNRSRDTGKTWQTVHTSVYDLENNLLIVIPQETGDEYEFELEVE